MLKSILIVYFTYLYIYLLFLLSFADAVQYVVLDEADKLLGLGFAPQIERLKGMLGMLSRPPTISTKKSKSSSTKTKSSGEEVRKRPQVGLFTATMPSAVRAVADEWLLNPKRIALDSSAVGAAPGRAISSTIVQVVQVCADHKKPAKLIKHLESIKSAATEAGLRHAPRVLIFCNRIKKVRILYKQVVNAGFRAGQLHGERSQAERDAAVADFKSGKAQVLIASDVAARGLDIRNLPYVVNYDFPANLETYVHRVGRTGRLAADGHAFSFLTREMAPLAGPLLGLLRDHDQSIDPNLLKLSEAYEIAAKKLGLPIITYNGGTGGNLENGAIGEEEAIRDKSLRPPTDDVLRELDIKSKARKKKDKASEAKRDRKRKAEEKESEDDDSDDDGDDDSESEDVEPPVGRKVATKKEPAKNKKAAAGPPEFVASKKFSGAKPGYIFKKRGLGVGYYLDNPPHMHLKALVAARKQLAAKTARAPIGGIIATKKAAPLLPGRLKALKKKQIDYSSDEDSFETGSEGAGAGGADGGSSDDDFESDAEEQPKSDKKQKGADLKKKESADSVSKVPPGAASASKRRGSLPGRLRKKLAKEKLAKGGK